MGDAFIVRRGGGGAFAMILVNYPAGSTVTCTNSSGKKDISSTQILFYVKKGVVPFDCVVTSTDGTFTATKTVSIAYEGQSETVTISYTELLYYSGNEYTDITGGWGSFEQGSLTKNPANMSYSVSSEFDFVLASNSKIDVSNHNKIKIQFGTVQYKPNGYQYFGLASSKTGAASSGFTHYAVLDTKVDNVVELDISNVNGSFYVKLALTANTSGTTTGTILKIWME